MFNLSAPEGDALRNILHCVLEANMTQNDSPGLVIDLHNAIVQASCKLLSLTMKTLRPSAMPGREYYAFSVRDVNNCFMVRMGISGRHGLITSYTLEPSASGKVNVVDKGHTSLSTEMSHSVLCFDLDSKSVTV